MRPLGGSGPPRSCEDLQALQRRIDALFEESNELTRQITGLVDSILDGSGSIDELWAVHDAQLRLAEELEELLSIDVDSLDRIIDVHWALPVEWLRAVRTLHFRIGNQHWNPWFGPDFTAVFEHTREYSAGRSLLPRGEAAGNLKPYLRYSFATSWRDYCEEGQRHGVVFAEMAGSGWRNPYPRPVATRDARPVPNGYRLFIRPSPNTRPRPGPLPGR